VDDNRRNGWFDKYIEDAVDGLRSDVTGIRGDVKKITDEITKIQVQIASRAWVNVLASAISGALTVAGGATLLYLSFKGH